MRPDVPARQRRESVAYEQAVAARDRASMDALARSLLS